ncbi:uncharacterized protein LOC129769384 isoform X1 [Toxorhynchites rutilus septentrionalis]|uniref:uncharacterized protein LOC129769384 isoform X1 n=1 Tax=Toxorhynchites rutilus septentrionalis TaxID=329112 RepID=UPI002479D7F0|nr:uncharacterized protein LOC129769384 isoform X1 [Toxorhynchites rutilus septentrionalis]
MSIPVVGDGRNAGAQAGGSTPPGGVVSVHAREVLRGSENYNCWAFSTKMVLIKKRTWCAVKDRNEGDPEVSDEVSEQALATICQNIDRSIYGLVQNAKTAKEAWDALRNTFEDSGSTRKIGLLRRLTGIRLVEAERDDDVICQSPQEYVNEIMVTCNQLSEVGFKVDDTWMCSLVLKGLPKKYDPMILGLESSGVALPGTDSKPVESEGVFFSKQNLSKKQVDKSGKQVDKSTVKCFRCKKIGHFASECQKEKRPVQKGNAAFYAANAVQSNERNDTDWFFDSGATVHLCRNKEILENPQDVSTRINVANNAAVEVVAKGSVKLEVNCGERTCDLTMSDVLCVPDLAINLLSVSKVCKNGFRVLFTKEECQVVDPDNAIVAIGREVDGLYKLSEVKKPVGNLVKDGRYELWHRRMGHLSASGMKRLKSMVTGLEFEVKDPAKCVPCIEAKHCRQPFEAKGHREDRILELVHSDLCGPMESESMGDSRYFLTFIDVASRKTVVYSLKSKEEVLESLQDYKALVENQTGQRIKRIRTDNGREYVNRNFRNFLRKEGI